MRARQSYNVDHSAEYLDVSTYLTSSRIKRIRPESRGDSEKTIMSNCVEWSVPLTPEPYIFRFSLRLLNKILKTVLTPLPQCSLARIVKTCHGLKSRLPRFYFPPKYFSALILLISPRSTELSNDLTLAGTDLSCCLSGGRCINQVKVCSARRGNDFINDFIRIIERNRLTERCTPPRLPVVYLTKCRTIQRRAWRSDYFRRRTSVPWITIDRGSQFGIRKNCGSFPCQEENRETALFLSRGDRPGDRIESHCTE